MINLLKQVTKKMTDNPDNSIEKIVEEYKKNFRI